MMLLHGEHTLAVHTFERICADDHVGDACAIFENEHSIVTSRVLIRITRLAAIELLVAEVLASSNHGRLRERNDASGRCRNVESLRRCDASHKSCKLDLSELHLKQIDLWMTMSEVNVWVGKMTKIAGILTNVRL
jgi:hypothetical protein